VKRALFLVLFFAATPAVATENCSVDWVGNWQLSAEGRPFAIITVKRSEHKFAAQGEITRYEQIGTAGSTVELQGGVKTKIYDRIFVGVTHWNCLILKMTARSRASI
jgi:hypothetical protein